MSDKELITTFFNDLKKYPQLPHEELVELFKKLDSSTPIGTSDHDRIRNQIAQANLRLVVSIAKQYARHKIPLIDLVQEGSIGLLVAIGKFRWEKGFKFSTYASWWIKQAIQQHLLKKKRLIRLPAHAATVQRKIIKAAEEHRDKTGVEPTNEELLDAVQASKTVLNATLRSGRNIISLNQAVGRHYSQHGSDRDTIEDRIEDTESPSPFDNVNREEMLEITKSVLSSLSVKEIAIIRLRSGLISDIDESVYTVSEDEEKAILNDEEIDDE